MTVQSAGIVLQSTINFSVKSSFSKLEQTFLTSLSKLENHGSAVSISCENMALQREAKINVVRFF